MHVNIIGYGYVGGAIGHLCKMNDVNFCTYDIVKKTENKALDNFDNIKKLVEFSENNNETNFYFISVPTPSKNSGECNIDIVENVINELNTIITKKTIVIIKSTLQPGTTRKIADN
jgi:UDP-N-acetyl-D-mannosaminuronate dehydrogenase